MCVTSNIFVSLAKNKLVSNCMSYSYNTILVIKSILQTQVNILTRTLYFELSNKKIHKKLVS